MNILCHRGWWEHPAAQNSLDAFNKAFMVDLGVETDIRDFNGEIVIAHDLPEEDAFVSADEFFKCYKENGSHSCLALNVKSDGLQSRLRTYIEYYEIKNYFVFDMSIPDMVVYIRRNFTVAGRYSEYEDYSRLYDSCEFVWLDSFNELWFSADDIKAHLSSGKKVAIVSPELHGRPHSEFWHDLKKIDNDRHIYLCTDLVKEAREYFNG